MIGMLKELLDIVMIHLLLFDVKRIVGYKVLAA